MNTLPLRHELKFFINDVQYHVLSGVLDRVLHRDPNGDENNEYHIRSLYFDTIYNSALFYKLREEPQIPAIRLARVAAHPALQHKSLDEQFNRGFDGRTCHCATPATA